MKKVMAMILVLSALLGLCACGNTADQATEPAAQSSSGEKTPQELYGHIDQTQPVSGIYKIWSAEGVQNMANHPDGKFELLCNVDMAGATIAPIGSTDKPFTGQIMGGNFEISNFTVAGGEQGDFGFVAVNKGTISSLRLKNVTFQPDAAAQRIGTLAGTNAGKISVCYVGGNMTVEQAPDNALCGSGVGLNTGDLARSDIDVNLTYTAPGSASIGGVAGKTEGGKVEFIDTTGSLKITGQNKKAGLLIGDAKDIAVRKCAFVGADNSVDGKLFTNMAGVQEETTFTECLWRDNQKLPLTDSQQALRDRVVEAMYEMGTIEWTVKQNMRHSCTCQLSSCHGIFNAAWTYYGIPYNHKSSSAERFRYCQNEDGSMVDWFYDLPDFDGFDAYIGSDCSSAVQQAWWAVSNSVNFYNTSWMPEAYGRGTYAVGDYKCDFQVSYTTNENGKSVLTTKQYMDANDEQTIYEAYGAMRKGDAYVYWNKDGGGHTRMAAEDAVVVRDQNGLIDPEYSYVLSHEQGAPVSDAEKQTYSSWKINWKYTFANLYYDWVIPVTCEELLTGEMEAEECEILDGADGYTGMFSGTVQANYHLDNVRLTITDSEGNTVMDHPLFVTVAKTADGGGNYSPGRLYVEQFSLHKFTMPLQNVQFKADTTYSYTLTASLATGSKILLKEDSFILGSTQ